MATSQQPPEYPTGASWPRTQHQPDPETAEAYLQEPPDRRLVIFDPDNEEAYVASAQWREFEPPDPVNGS